jgi:dipeptidyl aminopeptidase/acylaminoacyl peptidase
MSPSIMNPPDILSRYQAAEAVLDTNTATLVLNETVAPQWVGPRSFWYRRQRPDGAEFVWVEGNAARVAFDHAAVARLLAQASGRTVAAWELAVESITAGGEVIARAGDRRWRIADGEAEDLGGVVKPDPALLESPDGRQALFARGLDLYLRDAETDEERRLTNDGEEDFAWGRYPDAGYLAVVRRRSGLSFAPFGWTWSPDGAFLVGGRIDQRHVEPYPFIEYVPQDGGVRPKAYNIRHTLVGERSKAPIFHACSIEAATGRRIAIDLPDELVRNEMGLIEPLGWSGDNRRAFFAVMLAEQRRTRLYEIDVTTGRVRTLIDEPSEGFLNIGAELYRQNSIRILQGGREAIWYSERSGHGHLYRYDLATGNLVNAITSGEWLVRDILRVDEGLGRIYFTGSGREGGDPYQRRVYRVDIDGANLTLLSPEAADHTVDGEPWALLARLYNVPVPPPAISPDGSVFIDTWSTVETPSVSVLRSTADGSVLLPLETADASKLYATGWRAPEPFVAKAADGVTDLYGVIHRPRWTDGRPAPVIDGIYGGPQVTVVPHNFRAGRLSLGGQGRAALAALGAAVVVADGRGTPLRSKAFHDAGFAAFADTCLDDHVAVLKQLCDKDPSLDAARIGVYGHSFGGYTSARAILRHPDVYKVAVSSAGSHNLHGMYVALDGGAAPLADYGNGLRAKPAHDAVPENYRALDNASLAGNLRGKLLLAYGDMDENAFPAVTLQLCDALNKANRSYDLLCFPNGVHNFSTNAYFIRRMWDYFTEHLLGEKPPLNYEIGRPAGERHVVG